MYSAYYRLSAMDNSELENRRCPACCCVFGTSQGMVAHLSLARTCSWYHKGKRRQQDARDLTSNVAMEVDSPEFQSDGYEDIFHTITQPEHNKQDEQSPEEVMDELDDEFFQFIPANSAYDGVTNSRTQPSASTSGSSRVHSALVLDDDEDSRIIDIHLTAGQVIHVNEGLKQRWLQTFGSEDRSGSSSGDRWKPFASELDWRVACWAVKEGVGYKSLDRLLSIPGVRILCWI